MGDSQLSAPVLSSGAHEMECSVCVSALLASLETLTWPSGSQLRFNHEVTQSLISLGDQPG